MILCIGAAWGAENLLETRDWGKGSVHEGGEGHGEVTKGRIHGVKTNAQGFLIFGVTQPSLVDIVPGKSYKVSAKMDISGAAWASLMISMPGAKRTPYPRKELRKSGVVNMVFTAKEDERKLRPHIVVWGKGEVTAHEVTIEEILPMRETSFSGESLVTNWDFLWAMEQFNEATSLGALVHYTTLLRNSRPLEWSAEAIGGIEVDVSLEPEGGCLEVHYTSVDAEGKSAKGFVRRTNIPSGQIRTVSFDMGRGSNWKGRITDVEFKTNAITPSTMRVTAIRALQEFNMIPDAAKGGHKPIELIRPTADYHLTWRGKTPAEVSMTLFDEHHEQLKTFKSKEELTFRTPDETAWAEVSYQGGDGYPLLQCTKLPYSGKVPESFWNASWIWCANEPKPNDATVRMTREFTLPSKPVYAAVRYTADDMPTFNINGTVIKGNNQWAQSEKYEVTAALKAGDNRIEADVTNYTSYGGLLFELYAELADGKEFWLASDKSWRWEYNGKTGQAVEIARPPTGIWGDRMDCRYIGPMVKSQIGNLAQDRFDIMPEKAVGDFGEMTAVISDGQGRKRNVVVHFEPRSGQWKSGEWNHVRLDIKPMEAFGLGDDTTLTLKPTFLTLAGEASCTFNHGRAGAAEFQRVKLLNAGRRPWFEVDGRRLAPFYFDLPNSFVSMSDSKDYFVTNAAKAGSNIVRFLYGLRDFWKSPEKYDFASLDKAIAIVHSRMTDAHIIITLKTYMPDWWLDKYPDSRMGWFRENRKYNDYYQTFASEQFLADAPTGIRALIAHLRESGAAKSVIGIVFADGQTCEWMYPNEPYGGPLRNIFSGYAPADRAAYRNFLKRKYGEDPANADLPAPDEWNVHDDGIFIDPQKHQNVIDFFEFRNDTSARAIRTFAGVVKSETDRRLLSGAYYGYLVTFSRTFNQFQTSGHLAVHDVVSSGDCDLFFAPSLYGWRSPGFADSTMQLPESLTTLGGIPVCEFDYRTYSEFDQRQLGNGGWDTVMTTLSGIDRGFGMALVRGAGGHWMELHERWYREPILIKHIAKLLQAYRSLPEKPAGVTVPEVCLVFDEHSALRVANNVGDGVHRAVVAETCRVMPKTGVCYRQLLLDELLTQGLVPPHKFYVFMNTFELNDEQRAKIKARLTAEKASALWFYAPGAVRPGKRVDVRGIAEMTGIGVRRVDGKMALDCCVAAEFGGGERRAFLSTSPAFLPESGFDMVVARHRETPVIVARTTDGRTDYFSAALTPPVTLFGDLFRRAGVHSYQEGKDIVYAGNDFVVFNAVTAGRKRLVLPAGVKARLVLGNLVTYDAESSTLEAPAGATGIFLLSRE